MHRMREYLSLLYSAAWGEFCCFSRIPSSQRGGTLFGSVSNRTIKAWCALRRLADAGSQPPPIATQKSLQKNLA